VEFSALSQKIKEPIRKKHW